MYRACSTLFLLFSIVICTVSLDLSQIQVFPSNSGVFMVQMKNYSFNATQAVEVCARLSVRIASRDQVESAQRNGLQTCRYGWVEEQVAVIPRIEKNNKCGQSKIGVLDWRAAHTKLFDVFCYNSTAHSKASTTIRTPTTTQISTTTTMESQRPTETSNEIPHTKTTSPLLTRSTLLNKNILSSSTSAQSSYFSTSTTSRLFPSTIGSVNTRSPRPSSPSTIQFTTQYQLIPSSPVPLNPSTVSTFSISHSSFTTSMTSTSFSSIALSSHLFTQSNFLTDQTQSPSTRHFYFGDVALACIIIAVIIFLLAGLGAVWYFKIKRSRLPSWVRIRTNDMFETEMWKYTEQEHDCNQNEDKNCRDDITLMMEDYSEPC